MLNKILILTILLTSTICYSQNQLRIIYATGFDEAQGNQFYGNNTPDGAESAGWGAYIADFNTGAGNQPSVVRTGTYANVFSGVNNDPNTTVRSYAAKSLNIARTIYYTGWVYFSSGTQPVKNTVMHLIGDGIAIYFGFMWRTDGKWSLTKIDTVKATSTNMIPLDQWLYFKMYSTCTSSNNTVSITFNGETLTTNLPFTAGATNYSVQWGFFGTNPTLPAGTFVNAFYDDIVVYDTLGSQYTTPDSTIRIYYAYPSADSVRSNWTGGAGGTVNLWDGINNAAPVGTVLTETNISNIKDSVSSSLDRYYFKIASLNTLGYGSLNLRALIPFVRHGEHNSAATITGSFKLTTNPVNSSTSFTFGNDLTAHITDGSHTNGTEHWITTLGDIVYEPSMTKSLQTTMYVQRDSLNNAIGCVDQIGMILVTGNALGGANFQYHIAEW